MSTSKSDRKVQHPAPNELSNLTHEDFKAALGKTSLAILPVGSLEQHGPHLPASTDSIIVSHVASKVAENLGAFLLPAVSYGVSFEHAPLLNVSIADQTLSSLVADICDSLGQNGLQEVVVLNGHHGNLGALQYVQQHLAARGRARIKAYTFHYWHFLGAEFDHAGEIETSLMLAISPGFVRMERAVPGSKKLTESKPVYSAITSAPGSFRAVTGNGVWGDPRKASAEKGDKLVSQAISGLAGAIKDLKKFSGVQL